MSTANPSVVTLNELESALGPGTTWRPEDDSVAMVWLLENFDVVFVDEQVRDSALRSVWRARSGGGARPVVVLTQSADEQKIRVLGPQDPQSPVRDLPFGALLALLDEARSMPRRQAASVLAAEFLRLDESGIPGVGIRGLLTRHFLVERLRRSGDNWTFLTEAVDGINQIRAWLENLRALGYQLEQTTTGYLLRAGAEPVAVLHSYADPTLFSLV